MIFDNINNINNYKSFPVIYRVLQELSKFNLQNIPTSTVVYEKDNLFANPVLLTSKPESECIFEAHQKYLDIHYILEGIEGISTAHTSNLDIKKSFDYKNDVGFYTGNADGTYFLNPGDFMICWPTDAHKVAIMKNSPIAIKKIVFKIKVNLL
ncbi:YhcH/YjgK/YiaL family protein [Clostridium sp. AL.422]|uniref:YhcH/YjgK/YiaL family protein n=1 Tax=Clostridium TaxID=1485 RepID=UPI00293DC80A|nr:MULTISPECIES: YhcH/YjgK/YiaL family protein [unclassified Clostridium]MDV4152104.1 YhcH/YjgK/YiaL family protein [Clostridium sp. AL.422]